MERMKQVYEQIPVYRRRNYEKTINGSSKVQNKYPQDCPSSKLLTNVNISGEYICRTMNNTPVQNQPILSYQPSSSQYSNQLQIPGRRNVTNYFNMNGQLIGYDGNAKQIEENSHYNKIIHHRNIQYNQATSDEFNHNEYLRKLPIFDENNETFNDQLKVESNDASYGNNYVYENHFNQSSYDLIGNQERTSMMDTSGTNDCSKINQCLNINFNLDNNQG